MTMPSTDIKQHTWIKHTLTPVLILAGDDGEPVIFVDPDQQIISEDHAVYGCDRCGQPLVDNLRTECEGDPDAS